MIVIPESFRLGGREWKVKFRQKMPKGTLGECHSDNCEIHLKKGMTGETLHHTFYHELCHAVAFTMGWSEFNGDEDKIDAVGGLLYQFLNTKKGTLAR